MAWTARIILLASAAALALPPAIAAGSRDVIAQRQANFKQIGRSFKAMRDELRKDAPDIAVLRVNADALDKAAERIPGHFPKGSGPESGAKTEALPAIWAPGSSFASSAEGFRKLTGSLRAAAASGDLARIRAATGELGGGCKGCHDNFKAKH